MAQRSLWRFYSKKENTSNTLSSQPLVSTQNSPASSQGPWGNVPAKVVSDNSPFKASRNPYAFSGANEGTEPKWRVTADQPSLNKPPPSQRIRGYASDPRRKELGVPGTAIGNTCNTGNIGDIGNNGITGNGANTFGTPSAAARAGNGRNSFSPRSHFTPVTPGIKPCVPRGKRARDHADVDDSESDYNEGMNSFQGIKFASASQPERPAGGASQRVDKPSFLSQYGASQPDNSRRAEFLRALGADDLDGGQDKNASMWAEARSKFEWLLPENIRDGKGRRPGEPGYDSRSVTVPRAIFDKLSASQKQYWGTKSRYMDTILFFKVGKFYELYEVDAEVGHKELDWKLTVSGVGKCRQVGVPESGIEDAVQKLVARG
ncbi:unnamed protein product, partial [Closterium sp. NIES-54]